MNFINVTQIRTDGLGLETQVPTTINPKFVRCAYSRNDDQPGTRLTFADGGGFPISEAFDEFADRPEFGGFLKVDMVRPPTTEELGEDDGLSENPSVNSRPAIVNPTFIRCAYPRRPDSGPGTRLTFVDGNGFAITQDYDAFRASVQSQ